MCPGCARRHAAEVGDDRLGPAAQEGQALAKVAAYWGDTKETVLSVYAHFLPSDGDRAREVMNAFFAGTSERSCARKMPGGGVR